MNKTGQPASDPLRTDTLRVLIVDDSEADALLVAHQLGQGGRPVFYCRVETADTMRQALTEASWDVVLSDHNMPSFDSAHALAIFRERALDIPFIIVSGSIGEELAVAAMKAGASDYILKNNLPRLGPAVARELREAVDRRERVKAEVALLAQQTQMTIAREIQQGLFPQQDPCLPGWEVAARSQSPEDTGGDYYDYIPMAGGGTAIVVGDVSGHGVGPALLMASTRQCLRALSLTQNHIAEVLIKAHQLLKDDFGSDKFITLFMAQMDPESPRIHYLNAGHPHALIIDKTGRLKHMLAPNLPFLSAVVEMPPPFTVEVDLEEGDVMALLTDGILEAQSSLAQEFGVERVAETLGPVVALPVKEIVQRLFDAVADFTNKAEMKDDMTAVVIKRTAQANLSRTT